MNSDIHRLLDEAFAGHRDDARRAGPEGRGARQPRRPHRRARGGGHDRRRMPRARRSPSSATCASCSTRRRCRRPAPPRTRTPRCSCATACARRPASSCASSSGRSSSSSRITLAVLGATGVLPLPVGRDHRAPRLRVDRPRAGRGRLALAGDDDQPPDAAEPRRRLLPRHACSRSYGLGFAGLVALGRAADVVRRVRGARRDRLDHPVRVPRRLADQPPQGVGAPGAARRVAGRATGSRRSPRPPPGSASTPPSSGS